MVFNIKLITFSSVICMMGIILTYLTFTQLSKLPLKCVNKQVQISMNILLVLSTIMMISPIIQFICYSKCDCKQNDLLYKSIIISILILILITSSVILNGIKDDCYLQSLRDFMIGLIVISVIFIVSVGILPLVVPVGKKLYSNKKAVNNYDVYDDE